MSAQTQKLIVALTAVSQRREASRLLARHFGADELIIFVLDPEIGASLPAPGFPQTLPQGAIWRKFLGECIKDGHRTDKLPFPDAQTIMPATAVAAEDQSVLVLLGGSPELNEIKNEIGLLLPLLGTVFRTERAAISAEAEVRAARETAAQARALAAKLEKTRSELQHALITAETATRAKDEFLATVSHELRTPLNAILGWAQVLQSNSLDESAAMKALATVERNAHSQSQLIDDLLDVSRIITGKLRLNVRAVDLTSVVMSAVDSIRPAAEAKDIRVQTLLDPLAGPISGDPDRLQQVIWNLLSNAVKFTTRGGRVQVRIERINSHVEIIVSDTGKGIEPEFLPHVFDRFRQSDGSSTRRYGGLGLGLAIVRQLVELHGGTVSVESKGEGTGTTFIINLPLLPLRIEPAGNLPRVHPEIKSNGKPDSRMELAGLHILLVDDQADSLELLNKVLNLSGATVRNAASAAEAYKLVQSEKFDVIISDIGMPEEDGFSLISKIRNLSNEQGGNVPAIALTAYARPEDRVKALRSGFQMHISKPVEPSELIVVVANLTGRA